MILVTSPRFEEHVTPPGHPERPERAHVFDAVAARWLEKGGRSMPPRAAGREELERVHGADYVTGIETTSGRAVMLDADTFTSPESAEIALLAAGAAVQAAEHALDHREPAFALVRPPGHHAERSRAMGFCLYNNVAVAAAAMLHRGLSRVAIVDIDVHHGNGTQAIFYDDPRVLYISTHQHPFYPGTGAADEVGVGEGKGFTVNVPLEAGCIDADYELVHRAIVGPVLEEFAPELMLVSAGYDAHERDPLASMRVTTRGYAAIIRSIRDVAAPHAQIALVTEGGYELTALAACIEASLLVMDGAEPAPVSARDAGPPPGAPARGVRAVAAARAALKPFWRAI
jgi:acetoin utilization deacetylase AcuC-like enzyme